MILFNILSGGRKGTKQKIEESLIVIGRLPGSTLALDPYEDVYVHGKHAKIYLKDNQYILEDFNTKNGTFLNENIITSSVIKKGDIFKLGKEGPEILIEDMIVPEEMETDKYVNLLRRETGEKFTFSQDEIIIGRAPGCDLQLDPEKDIHVSGSHAAIKKKPDGYHLEDFDSANGSYINKFPCQVAKLENGDIISLGVSGVTFEFNVIKIEKKNLDEVIKKSPKNRKKIAKAQKKGNNHYKYICALSLIGIMLFIPIVILIFKNKKIEKPSISINNIKNNYTKSTILIYTRYLIYKDNKEYRGHKFGSGILTKNKKNIYLITNKEVIYPWLKNFDNSSESYVVNHMVVGWLYNTPLYLEKDHPFWRDIKSPLFDFSNTINNDIQRIGGIGSIIIPKLKILAKDNSILSLEISKPKDYLFDFCFPKKELAYKKISDKIYCVYYPEPLKSNLKKAIPLVLESKMENNNFSLAVKLSGSPIINSDGKFIALSSFKKNKLTYNFFKSNK